jgi:hypothetical protein
MILIVVFRCSAEMRLGQRTIKRPDRLVGLASSKIADNRGYQWQTSLLVE